MHREEGDGDGGHYRETGARRPISAAPLKYCSARGAASNGVEGNGYQSLGSVEESIGVRPHRHNLFSTY